MQIHYYEHFDPEAECIFLLERRFLTIADSPHSAEEVRVHLAKAYNIPMFELETMLQPLIDAENYVNSHLQVSEERLRFFFSPRGSGPISLARPLYRELKARPRSGVMNPEAKLSVLNQIIRSILDMPLEHIGSAEDLIRFLMGSSAAEDVKWICTALYCSLDESMEELDIILRKATALLLEKLPDVSALCRSAMAAARKQIDGDPVKLFRGLEIPQLPEALTVQPSLMGFHGMQWDFLENRLYYGVLYPQITDLVLKYSDQSASLVSRLKSIGDKSRLEILRMLRDGQHNGQDISEKLALAPATISHHTNLLCNEGLLAATKKGTSIYYTVNQEALQSFLRELTHYLL